MATTAAPYGARPVGLIGGQSFVGSTREFKIASGYAANIYNGQFVKVVAAGVVEADTSTTAFGATGVVGIFVGCSYTDSTYGKVFRHYWPTGTVAADAVAFVVDDPNVVMQMQADEAVAQTALGANIALVASAGSTATGNSQTALDGSSVNTTNTLPLRIVGFVEGPNSAVGDTYTDVLVKFNAGMHAYDVATGI
jgi:hypothetical protein